ncbi:unnamed protein product, partial [Closterium sp. NIES-54]
RTEAASVDGGTSGGAGSPHRLSTSFGLRISAAAPQASAANTTALKAIFAAALLPVPANKLNACTWPGLRTLSATRNFFSGGLPQRAASYAAMTSLEILDLGINYLSGPIPAALAMLPILQSLTLDANRLSGKIPPALLKNDLTDLSLDWNQLSGDLRRQQINPAFIGLSRNRLAGNFNTIRFNEYLSFINVSENSFSGSFPHILCRSGSLLSADLSHNRLTGTVPANCFKSASNILDLFLSHNNFTGGIPQSLTALPQLIYLDLGANALTGPIPTFCKTKQQLIYLNLASNALSGPPTPLSSPSCSASLAFLYLSSNCLSGPIPATISSFTRLNRLLLDKNVLTGAIPAGVSKMQRLQGLGLSYNRLTGRIPAVWPAGVRTVQLAGNRLSGAVPAALSKLKRGLFKPGNPSLCGKPLPACAYDPNPLCV